MSLSLPMASSEARPPPGTIMARGSGTSSNLFSGMMAIGVSEFMGWVLSPTVTTRCPVPLSRTVVVATRSSSATLG
jgi:hypothetical protein